MKIFKKLKLKLSHIFRHERLMKGYNKDMVITEEKVRGTRKTDAANVRAIRRVRHHNIRPRGYIDQSTEQDSLKYYGYTSAARPDNNSDVKEEINIEIQRILANLEKKKESQKKSAESDNELYKLLIWWTDVNIVDRKK
ncbi:MAG: hypothetical protein GX303_08765 [Clostridiales bacterium]|nr:hypothetical protein [Clostridiales bacterium]